MISPPKPTPGRTPRPGNGGYVFQHFSYASHTMYPTGSATAVDTAITTGTYSGSNNAFKWTPQSVYSGAGLLLYDTVSETAVTSSSVKYIGADQSLALRNLGITYSFYTDTDYSIYPTWTSSNTAVATVNASNGQVTGLSPGVTTITLSVYEEESDETFTKSYTLVVPVLLHDDFIRIEIGQTKTLADLGLEDFKDQANPTHQALDWESSDAAIANVDSGTGAVTAVSCGEVTITATASGATIIAYTLRVCRYANLLITNDGDFLGLSFEISPHFSSQNVSTYLKMINPDVVEEKKPYDKGFSKNEMIEYLKCASVVYIVAHGKQEGIIIDEVTGLMLTMNDLSGVDLSNLDLVVLLSCSTADTKESLGYPINFAERLYMCGAKTVVGFNRDIGSEDFTAFAGELTRQLVGKSNKDRDRDEKFDDIPKLTIGQAIAALKDGSSLEIEEGEEEAVGPAQEYDIVDYAVIYGDGNNKLGD